MCYEIQYRMLFYPPPPPPSFELKELKNIYVTTKVCMLTRNITFRSFRYAILESNQWIPDDKTYETTVLFLVFVSIHSRSVLSLNCRYQIYLYIRTTMHAGLKHVYFFSAPRLTQFPSKCYSNGSGNLGNLSRKKDIQP